MESPEKLTFHEFVHLCLLAQKGDFLRESTMDSVSLMGCKILF